MWKKKGVLSAIKSSQYLTQKENGLSPRLIYNLDNNKLNTSV